MKKINLLSIFIILILSLALVACGEKPDTSKTFKITGETTVDVGSSIKLVVEGFDQDKITWTTSNKNVATVVAGTVTGVAQGDAKISARFGSYGSNVTITVTGSGTVEEGMYSDQIAQIMGKMTLEQKVGQLFMVGLDGTNFSSTDTANLQKYHFGNYYIATANAQRSSKLQSLTRSIQSNVIIENEVPAFIGTTETFSQNELSVIDGFNYPSQCVIPNSKDSNVAKVAGEYIASELKSFGINFDFIYSMNTRTGVAGRNETQILEKAFSDHVEVVRDYSTNLVKGLVENNVVACGGLFPVYNTGEKSVGQTDDYFNVFKSAIANGMDAIMINDVVHNGIDSENSAIFSTSIINDFLIEKLGFSGIVTTVDLNNIKDKYDGTLDLYSRPAVIALYAGVNLFNFSSQSELCFKYYQDIIDAYNAGLLTIDVINNACSKILEMKYKYQVMEYDASKVNGVYDSDANAAFVNELAKNVVTQTSDLEFRMIGKDEKVFIISFEYDNFASGEKSFGEELERIAIDAGYIDSNIELYSIKNTREVRNVFNPDSRDYIEDLSMYDRVIVVFPMGTTSQSGWGGNDFSRIRGYLRDRKDGAPKEYNFVSMNNIDGSDYFNEEWPTLMVYSTTLQDINTLIEYLLDLK